MIRKNLANTILITIVFFGNDYEIKLKNELTQGSISKECAEWIQEKVEIKSFKKTK